MEQPSPEEISDNEDTWRNILQRFSALREALQQPRGNGTRNIFKLFKRTYNHKKMQGRDE
eukprot:scaffold3119_cov53-Attheya_sp.AAC.1